MLMLSISILFSLIFILFIIVVCNFSPENILNYQKPICQVHIIGFFVKNKPRKNFLMSNSICNIREYSYIIGIFLDLLDISILIFNIRLHIKCKKGLISHQYEVVLLLSGYRSS